MGIAVATLVSTVTPLQVFSDCSCAIRPASQALSDTNSGGAFSTWGPTFGYPRGISSQTAPLFHDMDCVAGIKSAERNNYYGLWMTGAFIRPMSWQVRQTDPHGLWNSRLFPAIPRKYMPLSPPLAPGNGNGGKALGYIMVPSRNGLR